jgi:ribosomal protein S18 acetylase RimI-like enzyme
MLHIIVANNDHSQTIRELFQEYLDWGSAKLKQEFGVIFDTSALVESSMQHLDWFMPPRGRLLLGYVEDQSMGIACLKALTDSIGEVKRMYVRPEARNRGLGRALLDRLLEEAQKIGYERVRLDSARFMKEAHKLYRTSGFREIGAYEGSEIPKEFQQHWVFMERELSV